MLRSQQPPPLDDDPEFLPWTEDHEYLPDGSRVLRGWYRWPKQ